MQEHIDEIIAIKATFRHLRDQEPLKMPPSLEDLF